MSQQVSKLILTIGLMFSAGTLFTNCAAAQSLGARCLDASGDKAIAICTQAINQDPNRNAGAFNSRGFEYARRGEYDKAIADFTEAIKRRPNDWQGWNAIYNRARAYESNGDIRSAISDVERLINIRIKNGSASESISDLQRYKEALQVKIGVGVNRPAQVTAPPQVLAAPQVATAPQMPRNSSSVSNVSPTPPTASPQRQEGPYVAGSLGTCRFGQVCRPDVDLAAELPRYNIEALCREDGLRNGQSAVGRCFNKQQVAYNELKSLLGKLTVSQWSFCEIGALAENSVISDMGYVGFLKCVKAKIGTIQNERSRQEPIDREVQQFKFNY